NGGHCRTISLDGEHGARLDASPVQEHRTRTALARVTADMGTREIELLAQEMHEQHARLYLRLPHLTIDGHRNLSHMSIPGTLTWPTCMSRCRCIRPRRQVCPGLC